MCGSPGRKQQLGRHSEQKRRQQVNMEGKLTSYKVVTGSHVMDASHHKCYLLLVSRRHLSDYKDDQVRRHVPSSL